MVLFTDIDSIIRAGNVSITMPNLKLSKLCEAKHSACIFHTSDIQTFTLVIISVTICNILLTKYFRQIDCQKLRPELVVTERVSFDMPYSD